LVTNGLVGSVLDTDGTGTQESSPARLTYHTNFVSALKMPPMLRVAVSPGFRGFTKGGAVITGSAFTNNFHGMLSSGLDAPGIVMIAV
jgi:hypothetical protein